MNELISVKKGNINVDGGHWSIQQPRIECLVITLGLKTGKMD